jgi:hypothetical protein
MSQITKKSKEAGKDGFTGGQKKAWIFAMKRSHQLADHGKVPCPLRENDQIK